jgi:IS5 family transposase
MMQKKELKKLKRIARMYERVRNSVEGKLGQGKRRFGLGRIFEKLRETSETAIMLGFLVMNLEKVLKDFIFYIFQNMAEFYLGSGVVRETGVKR